jgi:hypothetical protein
VFIYRRRELYAWVSSLQKKGTTEDAVIAQALGILFDLNIDLESDRERKAWNAISESSLRRAWDNEADAVYDNWKELYGLSKG